jgi:ABC-type nitrate/sulfonate/bicarbonate transport system permease component
LVVAAATCGALLTAACGASTTANTSLAPNAPTARPTPSVTTSPVSALTVTATQSIAVAKALFPLSSTMGGYTECDQDVTQTAACPFDARLRSQVAIYTANWLSEGKSRAQ